MLFEHSSPVTVNHKVGGSSPSQGAIYFLQLTHPLVGIRAVHETDSHLVGHHMAWAALEARSSPPGGAI
jgi:hypothetical protein